MLESFLELTCSNCVVPFLNIPDAKHLLAWGFVWIIFSLLFSYLYDGIMGRQDGKLKKPLLFLFVTIGLLAVMFWSIVTVSELLK